METSNTNTQNNLNQPPIPNLWRDDDGWNIRSILEVIWGLRMWIIISLAACALVGFIMIKAINPSYTRYATLMLMGNDNSAISDLTIISEITGRQYSKVENEILVLKSRPVMYQVVKNLNLNIRYYDTRFLRSREYYKDGPFQMTYLGEGDGESIHILLMPNADEKTFTLTVFNVWGQSMIQSNTVYRYGDSIRTRSASIVITRDQTRPVDYEDEYVIDMVDPMGMALSYIGALSASTDMNAKTRPDIIQLAIADNKSMRAEEVLNELMSVYNLSAREYKNVAIDNTVKFIDERLVQLEKDLDTIQKEYQRFRRENYMVDVESEVSQLVSEDWQYESQLTQMQLQKELLKMLEDNVNSLKPNELIAMNVGISVGSVDEIISQYNTLVMERNSLLLSAKAQNEMVKKMDVQLAFLMKSIKASIESAKRVYQRQEDHVKSLSAESREKIIEYPQQQFTLTQIEQQQNIKEPLYMLLQQRREEALISKYAISDNARVIEYAYGPGAPTSPNKKGMMTKALLIGFLIPILIYYLHQLMKYKVENKSDVQKRTTLPILAQIPRNIRNFKIMPVGGRDVVSESMRGLRSNLQFLQGKVFQVSSSLPSEGKSFIASNISVALAHSGKKVLLIGMDLRKPSLHTYFGLESKRHHGLVNYLSGRVDDIDSLILHGIASSHLDIILSGIIPPNPSELLANGKLDALIERFRNEYDYIICDSSPYIMVTDAMVINRLVDNNLFVIRAGSTDLRFIDELNQLAQNKQFKNICLIINDIDLREKNRGYYRTGYGYGRGYGYGYGHGRGYGYGYGEAYGDDIPES